MRMRTIRIPSLAVPPRNLPATIFVVFFLLGYFTAHDLKHSSNEEMSSVYIPNDRSIQPNEYLLQQQGKDQESFQTRIRRLQAPTNCDQARQLIVQPSTTTTGANFFEQFSREFHLLSLALQVAVSTGRMMLLSDDWVLLPSDTAPAFPKECNKGKMTLNISPSVSKSVYGIACLQQTTLSACRPGDASSSSKVQQQLPNDLNLDPSLSLGILPDNEWETQHSLFDVHFYGPQTIVEMPSWPFPRATMLIDVLPSWERLKGRFWVRSQMVHYIWVQWHQRGEEIGLPLSAHGKEEDPYIVFYWSSSKSLRKNLAVKYGRNASTTQSFERYMEVAEHIQTLYTSSAKNVKALQTIYMITDGMNEVAPPQDLNRKGWTFLSLPLSKTEQWNEEQSMLASLEVMRRADFLVGSFQSQTFRLACELNAALTATKYPATMRRHWALDVEWFENP